MEHDAYTLAVDLGGTKVDAALVSRGSIVAGSRHRQPTGSQATREELAASVSSALQQSIASLPPHTSIDRVGIATAGPIDTGEGTTTPVNLPAWKEYPLRDLVASAVLPLFPDAHIAFGLDGTAIALAEHHYGSGRGVTNFMSMVVSTGIGGGVITDGSLLRGASGNAGHIGQTYVSGFSQALTSTPEPRGPRAGFIGDSLTVEEVASGPASIAWARSYGWNGNDGHDLARDYSAGNEIAIAAVERSAAATGQAIAGASALLNLELVAIGGGFSRVTHDYARLVQKAVTQHPLAYARKTRVVASELGDDGPLLGAALLAKQG
ncbi:ROK family protein [Lysinibacter sp. HNR]|uniref:ROK family protein n=1 Tax=Lysinibacter sp. HNR TaxID=3031408 RepID=UPI0024354A0E|nr:ROK family protein [Lysinibacter sp. HNR]WGD36687.1 ROK family protein [Lysinibacter sp. HNR]